MMRRFAISSAVASALLSAAVALSLSGPVALCQTAANQPASASKAVPAQWQQEIATRRSQHEKEVSAPDGWLALAGLEWLETLHQLGWLCGGQQNSFAQPGSGTSRVAHSHGQLAVLGFQARK